MEIGHGVHVGAPMPENEDERLRVLKMINILDSEPEADFDRITEIASMCFRKPIALVSLLDEDRQWFKSRVGMPKRETSRDVAFCGHAILQDGPLLVEDATKDDRFKFSPLVQLDPKIRFYCGIPLEVEHNAQKHKVGTLCVIDDKPDKMEKHEIRLMESLAKHVSNLLQRR
ncbi:hypothetical protein GUITHDRAFT_79822, partial [Guillardia theta CCMP2712]